MKNKLLYLLTIIITLFTFNMNVNAAQELTCVYQKGTSGKLILAQNKSGELKLFLNTEDVSIEDNGWRDALKLGYKINIKDSITDGVTLDSKDNLAQCPHAYTQSDRTFYFRSSNEPTTNWVILSSRIPGFNTPPKLYEVIANEGTTEKCDNISKKQIRSFDEKNYIASCVYAQDTEEGCHIIQLDIKENGDFDILYSEPLESLGITISTRPEFDTINIETLKDKYKGWCPNELFVKRVVTKKQDESTFHQPKYIRVDTFIKLENIDSGYSVYLKKEGYGKNLIDETLEQTNEQIKDIILIKDKIDISSCEEIFSGTSGQKLKDLIKFFINLIKISIPVLLIAMGVLDFSKTIFSGKEDEMKKVQGKFIRRVIIAVCIYIIPTVLIFILKIASSIWPNISADFCGIL